MNLNILLLSKINVHSVFSRHQIALNGKYPIFLQKKNGRWTFHLEPEVQKPSENSEKKNTEKNRPNIEKDFKWFNNYLANLLSELSQQYTPLLTNKSKGKLSIMHRLIIVLFS